MDIVEYLYNAFPFYERQGKSGYKPGMFNSFALDEHFGYPHRSFKTIHIAGTKGKGSTSHMLASILQEQGYKTGLYTSPHLVNFNERIQINGKPIETSFIENFVDANKVFIESLSPSFFEVTTAMAFAYFAAENVDIAVIEVGLGGRLDCTNVISPILSVITNISKDHKDLLGDTLEKIAAEKAGIIKSGIPVVIGESQFETKPVFNLIAQEKKASIIFADQEIKVKRIAWQPFQNFEIEYDGFIRTYELGLLGKYQENNIKTVIQSLRLLQEIVTIDQSSIENGLRNVIKNTSLQGRWQQISSKPDVFCDIGHNEAGIESVMNHISLLNYDKIHIILGMVNDKDISSIMKYLPRNAEYYITKPSIERAMELSVLAKNFEKEGLFYSICENVDAAIKKVIKNADCNDLIFIGGSNFVVADALKSDIFSEKLLRN